MARLVMSDSKVRLELSFLEVLGAFHRSLEIDLDQVESVEVVENPWTGDLLKGVRAPGTGIPFVILLGTMRYAKGKDFCVFYRRKPTAVITLKSGPFKRWIVRLSDMSQVDTLKAAIPPVISSP
jgi:hypothetical protein